MLEDRWCSVVVRLALDTGATGSMHACGRQMFAGATGIPARRFRRPRPGMTGALGLASRAARSHKQYMAISCPTRSAAARICNR